MNLCVCVLFIAVLASLAVPSVAVEIVAVDASAQFARSLVRKKESKAARAVTAAARAVTAASAVNAGAVETGKESLVVEAGKEQQEGEANANGTRGPASLIDQTVQAGKRHVGKGKRACEGTMEVNETSLCSFFDSAKSLEISRHNPSFSGWHGSGPPYKIKYTIAPAGEKGLGAFAAQEVQKGDAVYCNYNNGYLVIDEKHMSLVQSIAAEFSSEVVERALDWCSEDYVCNTSKSILCEQDDGHFFNHDSNPSTHNCKEDDRCQCAIRDLKPGDELTENYDVEDVNSPETVGYIDILLQSAYSREARSETGLCAR